jgi:hypothetical protein
MKDGTRPRRRRDGLALAIGAISILPSGWLIGRVVKEVYVNSSESWMDDPWLASRWLAARVFLGGRFSDMPPLTLMFLACTGWSAFLGVLALWLSSSGRPDRLSIARGAGRFAILGLILSAIGVAALGALAALHFWAA